MSVCYGCSDICMWSFTFIIFKSLKTWDVLLLTFLFHNKKCELPDSSLWISVFTFQGEMFGTSDHATHDFMISRQICFIAQTGLINVISHRTNAFIFREVNTRCQGHYHRQKPDLHLHLNKHYNSTVTLSAGVREMWVLPARAHVCF